MASEYGEKECSQHSANSSESASEVIASRGGNRRSFVLSVSRDADSVVVGITMFAAAAGVVVDGPDRPLRECPWTCSPVR